MKDFQPSTQKELRLKLEKINYWDRIHKNKLLCKKQSESAARILQDGLSQIMTFYDEHLNYLCTIHRITNKDGTAIVHEHVKDCYLDGVWYKAVDEETLG